MDTETWLPVQGCPGYEVSDAGRVRSFYRRGYPAASLRDEPIVLRPYVDADGYHNYRLRTEVGTFRRASIHRLVLTAFVRPPVGREQACHNDGDPANNRLANLRWDTAEANGRDQYVHGTRHFPWNRRTHCLKGHELTEANTLWVNRSGKGNATRHCRECNRIQSRNWYAAHPSAARPEEVKEKQRAAARAYQARRRAATRVIS